MAVFGTGTEAIALQPAGHRMRLRNLFATPLEFMVRNDSVFFDVDICAGTVEPFGEITLTLRPNGDAMREHSAMVLKMRYLEEHFTLYNRNNLREKCKTLTSPCALPFALGTDAPLYALS